MATLLNPFLRALDANADAVSGGLLYVFEAGTTTPVTTYSDSAMTTAQAQPLVANTAGEFEQSFIPNGTYKIRIADAGAVVLYENDNVRMADRPDDPVTFDDEAAVAADTSSYSDGTILFALAEGTYFEVAPSGATNYDLTNAAGEKLRYDNRRYVTVAALLGSAEQSRGEGELWFADAFTYKEAASGAADHHVTTASGVKLYVLPDISGFNVMAFGAVADGATNDATAIQAGVDAASGRPLHFPAGEYVVSSTITMESGSADTFNQGPQIIGDGIGKTVFNNRVSSGAMFDVSSGGVAGTNFLMGAVFRGFQIERTEAASAQIGINISASYMVEIDQVHIRNISGDGIKIPCTVGDNDGSNMVSLNNVRIEDCTGWGIDTKADSGFNETSFIYMNQVFIQACGTTSGDYQPPSGGMRWKGQILSMVQCAFTLNENCALWIPGEAGLAQSCLIRDTTFENNKVRAIFSRGIRVFKCRDVQFYSNDAFTMTNAVEFEAGSYTVGAVDINGAIIRATSGNNAYTAFKISGANAEFGNCFVRNVVYDEWGHAGQTEQSGFQSDPMISVNKTSAQSIFTSVSAMVFNNVKSDEQLRYNPAVGRYSISYARWANFNGQITVASAASGEVLIISLYDFVNAVTIGQVTHVAFGATSESFPFDFTAQIGLTGSTRDYEIRAVIVGATRSMDVSSEYNNTLEVRPVSAGVI